MLRTLIILLGLLSSSSAYSQTSYTFIGNGNWSDTLNWLNQSVPPRSLPKGAQVIIDPAGNGVCILDVLQTMDNSQILVQPNKKLIINGDLVINWREVNSNVHVIDSSKLNLTSDSAMLSQGIYQFTSADTIPLISIDDIIVGPTNEGYLRKVTGVTYFNRYSFTSLFSVLLTTVQANLEDVFKKGKFNFDLQVDNSMQGSPGNALSYNFPATTLYQNGPLSIILNNGNITLDPNWHFDFDFANSTLKHFEVSCRNAGLSSNFQVTVAASQAVTLANQEVSLKHFSKSFTKLVPVVYGIPVPVVVVIDIDLVCKYSADINGSISKSFVFNSTNTLDLGVKYETSQWQPIYNFNSDNTATALPTAGDAHSVINVSVGPRISFKLYKVAGPYLSVDLAGQANGNIAIPSLDWDFSIEGWLKTELGANAAIFGHTLFNYSHEWETDRLILYDTPDSIAKISGDNQTGTANQVLAQPVKVRILDSENSPQANVPVYFSVTAGGGSVQNASMLSDNDGYAQTAWTLGAQQGIQTIAVTAKKADGSLLNNAAVNFTAGIANQDSTFIDARDGQVYQFKHIGSQVWMTQNLNYAAPNSWCYNDNPTNCSTYGRLYDWNTAVTVAPPAGWHLPSDAEWLTLINFLGGQNIAGGPMKDTTLWFPPNTGATNGSGFKGLPAGLRDNTGAFMNIGYVSQFWTSTGIDAISAWFRGLAYNIITVPRYAYYKSGGFPVRCVRN